MMAWRPAAAALALLLTPSLACAPATSTSTSTSTTRADQVWLSTFGAAGDGTHDDSAALSAAIDACRAANRTLHVADGRYLVHRALNWSAWAGVSIRGETPGSGGYNRAARATLAIVASPSVMGVAHDFTSSMYGIVEGIAFEGSSPDHPPQVQVLIGRSVDGDGSESVWRRINFGAGRVAAVIMHMSEVMTFEACRFHPSSNSPGLVITYRADLPPWNVVPPSGLPLTTHVSMTVHRFIACAFAGGNGPGLYLDNAGVRETLAILRRRARAPASVCQRLGSPRRLISNRC
jgi:hypothetical protein